MVVVSKDVNNERLGEEGVEATPKTPASYHNKQSRNSVFSWLKGQGVVTCISP